jgi:hypothetical protein
MIFGILNIGFGFLDLFFTLFTMFVLPKLGLSDSAVVKQMNDSAWTKITLPLDGLVAVALLVAGIGLLRSQNWARITSIVIGSWQILECVIGAIVAATSGASGLKLIESFLGAVVGLIYPVLLIIFMTRPNIVAAFGPAQAIPE